MIRGGRSKGHLWMTPHHTVRKRVSTTRDIYKLISKMLDATSDRVTLRKLSLHENLKQGHVKPDDTEVHEQWGIKKKKGSLKEG